MNVCIECNLRFLPTGGLWLFCQGCQSKRDENMAHEALKRLERMAADPANARFKDEIAKMKAEIIEELYNAL